MFNNIATTEEEYLMWMDYIAGEMEEDAETAIENEPYISDADLPFQLEET